MVNSDSHNIHRAYQKSRGLIKESIVANKPFWNNECDHPEDSYVGSFEIQNGDENGKYDVYLFPPEGKKSDNDHICIRYGNEGNEYISPGSLKTFTYNTEDEPEGSVDRTALELIQKKKQAYSKDKDYDPSVNDMQGMDDHGL